MDIDREAEALRSDFERLAARMTASSYVVSDQTGMVEVTVNGRLRLTGLRIDDRILGLGAHTVTERINEAMHEAVAYVAESAQDDVAALRERISEVKRRLGD